MIISEGDYIRHYGILRRSGRYPWGSGETPYQRNGSFLAIVEAMRNEDGMSDVDIARAFDMTTTQLRAVKSIAKTENKAADVAMAQRLKDKGYSNVAIGERMSINESSVRALLAPGAADKVKVLNATSDMLKRQVAEKGLIDVGTGVELSSKVGVSRTKLNIALAKLQEEGYEVYTTKVEQLGTGKMTRVKVLAPPGTTFKEVYQRRTEIKQIDQHTDDRGRTYDLGLDPPKSVSSKRIKVNYAEDGGADADGVIYLRPGVSDLSLGKSKYAQVRIAVDGTHYLKGMAVYKSDLPDGVDVIFNTNKTREETGSKLEAMKLLKDDPDNPFGAVIDRQSGALNIISEEGDWKSWSKTLSTQVLSKQKPKLIQTQLDLTYERKRADFEEISQLTNPLVKKRLLDAFADGADSSAVHLEAAAMPRQAWHVILPVNELKANEIYAPNYRNGETVAVIRYPHGGIFEIPELVVNNKNSIAKKMIGQNAPDAVGINSKVGERLSGADFDGDTVLVIPNDKGKIQTAKALKDLKNFDPHRSFPAYEGMKPVGLKTMQIKMGDVSNLITDMTIRGASQQDVARAVKHSMVVIDSHKHNLNYKQSEIDNGIPQLKEKYQGSKRSGASTLVSLAKSGGKVPERRPRKASEGGPIDRATGKRVFVETGNSYVNKNGKVVKNLTRGKKLELTDDAFTLSSGTTVEQVYAAHSNRLKSLANEARRVSVNTDKPKYSASANKAYAPEVGSLDSKLRIALSNAPRERQAQVVANRIVEQKKKANPNMVPEEEKKIKGQALAEARVRTGASKQRIDITPKEWDAIQAGAISSNKLGKILSNTDLDVVKQLATPRTATKMTPVAVRRAKAMANAGYTQAEIASALGVSATSISTTLSEGG